MGAEAYIALLDEASVVSVDQFGLTVGRSRYGAPPATTRGGGGPVLTNGNGTLEEPAKDAAGSSLVSATAALALLQKDAWS